MSICPRCKAIWIPHEQLCPQCQDPTEKIENIQGKTDNKNLDEMIEFLDCIKPFLKSSEPGENHE